MVVVGWSAWTSAQTTLPYKNLVITEAQMHTTEDAYFEITNMGTETVNLKDFEFTVLGAWDGRPVDSPWPQYMAATGFPKYMRLSTTDKMLAPGKSFLISAASDFNPKFWKHDPANYRERVTRKEFYSVDPKTKKVSSISDMVLHIPEYTVQPWKADSVSTNWHVLECWGGRETWFLRHHYINPETQLPDSAVIDQVGGVFDESDNTNNGNGQYSVAGVVGATDNCILIRRNSVKTGNLDFNTGRGVDFADSEWIPIPGPGLYDFYGATPWTAVFWTAGNQLNATFDANTLVSKTGKTIADINNNTITVPWGVIKGDSLMFQFKKTPGLAWVYIYSKNAEDSVYLSARTDDTLKVYACGDKVTIKNFAIKVLPATADDNIVIPKCAINFQNGHSDTHPRAYGGMRVTNGVSPIDSITNIAFAIRVDTLYKYLEKAPKASWKIKFKSGVAQPDLKNGDILSVTSENGKVKDYFLKLEKYSPGSNALLSAITWPDMPEFYKDFATNLGWKHDTIPAFGPANKTYVIQVPLDYDGIPALTYSKQSLNSKVVVKRAKNLAGSVEDRTLTFTVTAENDTVISNYTIRFDKEKDFSNVQPFIAEPFISQFVFHSDWSSNWLEIANPGTEIIDLSNYMIAVAYATEPNAFDWNNNNTTDWANRYFKYIPGKKWQDQASWGVQPRIAIPDPTVNSIVYPQEVFVMAQITNCNGWLTADKYPHINDVDINFGTVPTNVPGYLKLSNPWNENINGQNIAGIWCNNVIALYKIKNTMGGDSVKNGTKAATDRADFELIDQFGGLDGNNWKIGGYDAGSQCVGFTRKTSIYKGNPVPNGSFGTNNDDSEWTHQRPADYNNQNLGWPWTDLAITTGIGSITLDEITVYRSTVSSIVYKVSPGYSAKENIRGLTTGTTVSAFYNNIIKATPAETLKVKSSTTGLELAEGDAILNGDSLIVMSADSTNTTKYTLDVSTFGLNADARLTSTMYDLQVNGATGTIGGFSATNPTTPLKDIVAGIQKPYGSTLTLIDENDAYMSLKKLNFDSLYVDVVATDKIYFEVVAENGITKITYQLKPNTNPSDAFVTSDVYSVAQDIALIDFIPGGCTVATLVNNLTPAPGASITIYDKAGFVRSEGTLYRDDKLVVTSADGTTTKAYYFSMLNFKTNTYLAFVISDNYTVNQVTRMIMSVFIPTTVADFYTKLTPAPGATMQVIDKNGNVSTQASLVVGDQLVVTALDGITTTTYSIDLRTVGISNTANASIRIYPNPTTDKVIINGLTKGNRVRVINAAGVLLRDVTVDISTEYVSLSAQPAGVYVFVISSGNQFINIQKVIKK